MKIIDKYILKKFLLTFFFCIGLMTLVVMVIDISEKTDDFVKSQLGAWQIFTDYYLGFLPRIDAMLFPLFVFIAVIFFTAKMAERTEIVAILSSGVSFRRFLLPYWIGGGCLSLLLWGGYHYVLPKANSKWSSFESKYIPSSLDYARKSNTYNYYFRLDSFSFAGLQSFDTVSKSGRHFFVQRFNNHQLQYNLRSETIFWDTAQKKWKLTTITERFLKGDSETVKLTPERFMSYNFRPRDLRRDDFLKDRLSTKELNQSIALEKLRGTENIKGLQVERYNRDAIPVSVLILALIGAILSSKKVRGGSGFHLATGVVLSVLYILCSRFSLVFATQGNFHPLIAAWTPNVVFGLLAFYFYHRESR
jgi:lipopolysaccharide export system permease protein